MKDLAAIRIEKRMTQADIAQKANIAISTYCQYEKGGRMIPREKAVLIAEALDCPMEDIFLPMRFAVSKQPEE